MTAAAFWWFLARSSGLVAGVLLVATLLWGILASTRLLKPVKRPAWVLDLHRWLGGLTIVFVVIHLVSLTADSYADFDLESILVPFASDWRPVAVTWGVVGLYLLIAVQLTSWTHIRSRLSLRVWRTIHLLSFPLVWVVAMHSGAAGTDVGNRIYLISVLVLVALTMFVVLYRLLAGRGRGPRSSGRPSDRVATGSGRAGAGP